MLLGEALHCVYFWSQERLLGKLKLILQGKLRVLVLEYENRYLAGRSITVRCYHREMSRNSCSCLIQVIISGCHQTPGIEVAEDFWSFDGREPTNL